MPRDKENLIAWRKKTLFRYNFVLNKESEKDVVEHFEKAENKRQYLIDLIRKDIKKKRG